MEISSLSVSVLGCRFIERDFCRIEFPRKSETKMLLSVLSGKLPWSVCSHHYIRLGKTTLPPPTSFQHEDQEQRRRREAGVLMKMTWHAGVTDGAAYFRTISILTGTQASLVVRR